VRGVNHFASEREFEHPRQCREQASSMEVELMPPCRQRITEAMNASAMMSLENVHWWKKGH
jgi:hypothetical protein